MHPRPTGPAEAWRGRSGCAKNIIREKLDHGRYLPGSHRHHHRRRAGPGQILCAGLCPRRANVVVNDIGTSLHGEGRDTSAADAVVEEIRAAGGKAVANYDDITDWDAAGRIVRTAIDSFGGLDVVVNNAGIVRDRMFVSATLEEWDATMHVHLRGHFCVSRHAVDHWRAQQKAGNPVDARIINTTSAMPACRDRWRSRPIQPRRAASPR
jgi:NAD(P)-dependent dehydrogenase (short-subunit alcohol dehydrogenase family)